MTKIILEIDNNWTKRKIINAINIEIELLRKAVYKIQTKLKNFEKKYGKLNQKDLYGKVNDMELLEWEGEIETLTRLKKNLISFEEITFEYK